MMKKISILHLGGTISSKVDYKTGGVSSKFSEKDMLELYPEIKKIAKISSRLIANMLSEDMNFQHYNLISKEIQKEVKKGTEGIIITHGTDTLHYTSAALSFILEHLPIPVILVGAQRSSDRGSSDAELNLICALNFIAQSNFSGIAVCMHSSTSDDACLILPPTKSRKIHSSRRDAFKAINSKPIARVTKQGNIGFIKKITEKNGNFKLYLFNPDLKIGILKSHPNLSSLEIKNYSKFDGLVIEGTGLGHIAVNKIDSLTNENENVLKELKKLAKKIPIIMTTQCIFGRTNLDVYSSGRKLQEAGILGTQLDMTTETAFIKLAWLLSNHKKEEIPKLINKNYRNEISSRTSLDFLDYVYT
ncbi:MAG: Glu-tRNA(Gln) amidotransferase GatDE subunit D [Nanoarchaeota archaeon]|nr:Glu-tRNA(Gln) amidotransferase GatDE subunit D [Nanoarchaeota archaeon]|tara:strand:+ start:569 stop:1651 length:1083 start_codon:yes stop_codon:yes gene_type:complete